MVAKRKKKKRYRRANGAFCKNDEWGTPQHIFDQLNDIYDFTLDPCSTNENAKCEYHYVLKQNGLSKSWASERVFMHPPSGNELVRWVEKAYYESRQNNTFVIGILPAKTDAIWFHEFIYKKEPHIEFDLLCGRIRFVLPSGKIAEKAPFSSMIVRFGVE